MENRAPLKHDEDLRKVNYNFFSKRDINININKKKYLQQPPVFPMNPIFDSNEPLNLKTLSDLIELAKSGKGSRNYDWLKLIGCVPDLEKLDSMIGMKNLKTQVKRLVISNIMRHECDYGLSNNRKNHHFVIYGGPGCGKTEVSKILSSLYCSLGIVPEKKILFVAREDIIGEYVGQSEPKTKTLLESAVGGVIVFEEIYSLAGDKGGSSDSFAKSVTNVINRFLSEREEDFVCGFIGHRDCMEKLWGLEPGLRRRFSTFYDVDGYEDSDLYIIFRKMLDEKYLIEENQEKKISKWFENNASKFPFFGGDVKNFVSEVISSSQNRRFGTNLPPKITFEDIREASEEFFERRKATPIQQKIDNSSAYFT